MRMGKIPNPKSQTPNKPQAPIYKTYVLPGFQGWSLFVGAFLGFGAWSLEFLWPARRSAFDEGGSLDFGASLKFEA
jgi:hypothetical protein